MMHSIQEEAERAAFNEAVKEAEEDRHE